MTRQQYDSIPAERFSNLKHILTSPALYLSKKLAPDEDEETEAMAVGTLVHAMVLEKKSLLDLYAIKPLNMKFNTKAGIEWRDAQTLPILGAEAAARVPRMAEAIMKHRGRIVDGEFVPGARELVECCPSREHAIFGEIEGEPFKCLLDAVGNDPSGRRGFPDVKTMVDASPRAVAQKVMAGHYDLQVAAYSRLLVEDEKLEHEPWCAWIVVEGRPPYEVACYNPNEDMIRLGRRKLEIAMDRLLACRKANQWPRAYGPLQSLAPAKYQEERVREMALWEMPIT